MRWTDTLLPARSILAVRVLLGVVLVVSVTGCGGGSEQDVEGSQPQATLTVRRELPAGPIWTEGSTMVVRVFDGGRLVHEVQAGDGYYEPAEAVITLVPGPYRVEAAQTPCVETCRGPLRDAERASCERVVEIDDRAVELVAEVPDPHGCDLRTSAEAQRTTLPAHYEGEGEDCGSYVVEQAFRNDGAGAAEQDCLFQAVRSGRPAFMSTIVYGTEGHPSRWGYQVRQRDEILVEHDWNNDPLGPSGIERTTCTSFVPSSNGLPLTSGCT